MHEFALKKLKQAGFISPQGGLRKSKVRKEFHDSFDTDDIEASYKTLEESIEKCDFVYKEYLFNNVGGPWGSDEERQRFHDAVDAIADADNAIWEAIMRVRRYTQFVEDEVYRAGLDKSKKSKVKKDDDIEEEFINRIFRCCEKIAQSEFMNKIYEENSTRYSILMGLLSDAENYAERTEYSYASECLSMFTTALVELDYDLSQIDLDELNEIQKILISLSRCNMHRGKPFIIIPNNTFYIL